MKMRKSIFSFLLLFISIFATAQDKAGTDSLQLLLTKNIPDTTRLNILLQLSNYYRFAEPEKGKSFSTLSIKEAKKEKNDKALGDAYHYLASSYFQVANYDSSEIVNRLALEVRLKINDEKGLAGTYTNLGQLLGDKGKSEEAFSMLHKAEKIYEKLKNEKNLAAVYNSIGNLYYSQKMYELAYSYMQKSLDLRRKLNDSYGAISALNNLGHITYYLYGPDSALIYYNAAVNSALGVGDVYTQVQSLNNLASYYMDTKEPDKAISTIKKAISIGENTEYESLLANSYLNYGRLLSNEGKTNEEALRYALKGMKIVNEGHLTEMMYQANDVLAGIYNLRKDYKLAYEYMYKAYLMKDTFIRQSVQIQMSDLETKYQSEKKQLEITNLKQNEKLSQAEINKKNLQLIMIAIFSIFLLVMGYIVLKAYRQKRKDNELIQMQKELVEEKNREITDSITYAKRIQRALITSEKYIERNLNRLNKK
jgi:tetratricopeptide (TPR) repeat protein